jgi:hypothetical protein
MADFDTIDTLVGCMQATADYLTQRLAALN